MNRDTEIGGLSFSDMRFAVVDIETTGLDGTHDRPVEISIVHVTDGRIEVAMDTLIDPEGPVAWTELHGITDWDVADAPTFAEVADLTVDALAGRVLVSHNAEFDLRFLGSALTRAGRLLSSPPHVCTLRLVRAFCPSAPSHALGPLCASMGLAVGEPHSARADAVATAKLLSALVRVLAEAGIATPDDLRAYAGQTGARFPFLASLRAEPWRPSGSVANASLRPREGVDHNWQGTLALRRYRDELLDAVIDLEVSPRDAAAVPALRQHLGLSPRQVMAMHSRVFHERLGRWIADDAIEVQEAVSIQRLGACLHALGWAPGDPPIGAIVL